MQGRIPVDIVRRLLVEYMEEQGEDYGIADLERETDISSRPMYRLLNEDGGNVEFDTADRIVTRLFGPMRWHVDPELAEVYESVNLRAVDWYLPTSATVADRLRQIAADTLRQEGTLGKAAERIGVTKNNLVRYLPSTGAVAAKAAA